MEVICDDFLRVCWLNFGAPGARNDAQIMNQRKFFNDLRTGQWPPACPEVDICGFKLKWFYLLSGGIYPAVWYLMSSISSPRTLTEKLYAKQQEGARKAVERVFGVIFKRFRVMYQPSRLWHVEDMELIVKARVTLHNMTCEENKHRITGSRAVRLDAATSEFANAYISTSFGRLEVSPRRHRGIQTVLPVERSSYEVHVVSRSVWGW
jgi:hypothetical protein